MGIILGTIAAISAAAVSVAKSLAVVGLAVEGLKLLGNAIMGIAKALGLIKPQSNVEDLGDKALQAEADGITIDEYDSYAEYVKAVEDYDADPEKSKLIPEDIKVQKGIELTTGVLIEKFPELPVADFIEYVGKNPGYFTEGRMREIGNLIKNDGKCIANILNYMNGSEKDDLVIDRTIQSLMNIEKKVNPDFTNKIVLKDVLNLRK